MRQIRPCCWRCGQHEQASPGAQTLCCRRPNPGDRTHLHLFSHKRPQVDALQFGAVLKGTTVATFGAAAQKALATSLAKAVPGAPSGGNRTQRVAAASRLAVQHALSSILAALGAGWRRPTAVSRRQGLHNERLLQLPTSQRMLCLSRFPKELMDFCCKCLDEAACSC